MKTIKIDVEKFLKSMRKNGIRYKKKALYYEGWTDALVDSLEDQDIETKLFEEFKKRGSKGVMP